MKTVYVLRVRYSDDEPWSAATLYLTIKGSQAYGQKEK
jgi:hypothetical protein